MPLDVADTSALVSLGTVASEEPNPLDLLLAARDVVVPEHVVGELHETAAYEDASAAAAQAVLDRRSSFDVRATDLDDEFPMDDGENAAVTLANDLEAAHLLCDEFNRLALVHASVADTRLVTTPILLTAFVRIGTLSATDAESILAKMSEARSWEANSYVQRAEATLRRESRD